MAVTIEDLYRCYGVLADAKDLSQVGEAPRPCWATLWDRGRCLLATWARFSSSVLIVVDLRN